MPEPLCYSITQSSPKWNTGTAVLLNKAAQSKMEHRNLCVTQ